MFGLRIVTKREILLWRAVAEDLRDEIARLRAELKHERQRAEGAINALLAKCAGLVVTGHDRAEMEAEIDSAVDIFNDGAQDDEQKKLMEELQS